MFLFFLLFSVISYVAKLHSSKFYHVRKHNFSVPVHTVAEKCDCRVAEK